MKKDKIRIKVYVKGKRIPKNEESEEEKEEEKEANLFESLLRVALIESKIISKKLVKLFSNMEGEGMITKKEDKIKIANYFRSLFFSKHREVYLFF